MPAVCCTSGGRITITQSGIQRMKRGKSRSFGVPFLGVLKGAKQSVFSSLYFTFRLVLNLHSSILPGQKPGGDSPGRASKQCKYPWCFTSKEIVLAGWSSRLEFLEHFRRSLYVACCGDILMWPILISVVTMSFIRLLCRKLLFKVPDACPSLCHKIIGSEVVISFVVH